MGLVSSASSRRSVGRRAFCWCKDGLARRVAPEGGLALNCDSCPGRCSPRACAPCRWQPSPGRRVLAFSVVRVDGVRAGHGAFRRRQRQPAEPAATSAEWTRSRDGFLGCAQEGLGGVLGGSSIVASRTKSVPSFRLGKAVFWPRCATCSLERFAYSIATFRVCRCSRTLTDLPDRPTTGTRSDSTPHRASAIPTGFTR
jgi:hypothetical protein